MGATWVAMAYTCSQCHHMMTLALPKSTQRSLKVTQNGDILANPCSLKKCSLVGPHMGH